MLGECSTVRGKGNPKTSRETRREPRILGCSLFSEPTNYAALLLHDGGLDITVSSQNAGNFLYLITLHLFWAIGRQNLKGDQGERQLGRRILARPLRQGPRRTKHRRSPHQCVRTRSGRWCCFPAASPDTFPGIRRWRPVPRSLGRGRRRVLRTCLPSELA